MRPAEIIGRWGQPFLDVDYWYNNGNYGVTQRSFTNSDLFYQLNYNTSPLAQYPSLMPGDVAVTLVTDNLTTTSPGWTKLFTLSGTNGASLKISLWVKELTAGSLNIDTTWTGGIGVQTGIGGFIYRSPFGINAIRTTDTVATEVTNSLSWTGNDSFVNLSAVSRSSFAGDDQYQRVDILGIVRAYGWYGGVYGYGLSSINTALYPDEVVLNSGESTTENYPIKLFDVGRVYSGPISSNPTYISQYGYGFGLHRYIDKGLSGSNYTMSMSVTPYSSTIYYQYSLSTFWLRLTPGSRQQVL